jgi:hypothetical protein
MFDIEYTATWDGNYLSVVAVVLVTGDDRLRSSEVLKPSKCTSPLAVSKMLFAHGFVAQEIILNQPFKVEKISNYA